jgi:hypothetical protein
MIFCDNKSLIHRINERKSNRITVNQHNFADVDLELQIILEIKELKEQNIEVSIIMYRATRKLEETKHYHQKSKCT